MMEQSHVKTGTANIDEPTARDMMGYYRINHDAFVNYVKSLGIEHND
jgi:hypothetical protein